MKGWADRFTCPSEINVLDWESWDVSELKGKSARIQIVDRRRRDWGHISVDHIYQSDVASKYVAKMREFHIDSKYLNFPVDNGARGRLQALYTLYNATEQSSVLPCG